MAVLRPLLLNFKSISENFPVEIEKQAEYGFSQWRFRHTKYVLAHFLWNKKIKWMSSKRIRLFENDA